MHTEAYEFVSKFATQDNITVIEIGSRDLNGSVRQLFPCAVWVGLDLYPGPAVDIVCDAASYVPDSLVDLVVCCEVLEHAPNWRELIQCAASWLQPGGRMIITCAGPGRAPHSHHDGGELREGEYYGNLSADAIAEELHYSGLHLISCDQSGEDTQAAAFRL